MKISHSIVDISRERERSLLGSRKKRRRKTEVETFRTANPSLVAFYSCTCKETRVSRRAEEQLTSAGLPFKGVKIVNEAEEV